MTDDTVQPARRSAVRSAALIGILAVCFALLPLQGDRWWLGVLVGAAVLAAMVPLTVRRLRRVLRSGRPGLEALEALVLLSGMLVLGFAAIYFAMNRDGDQLTGLDTRIDALYFTMTTLSTVGYGDITASGQAARLVVTTQIVCNLIFVGVAVRVFTGAARRAGRQPADAPGA